MTDATAIEFTDSELRTATAVSRRVSRVAKGYVEEADVLGYLYLWMWEHRDKIARWRDEGKPTAYLSGVFYKQGLNYVAVERRHRTGSQRGDETYYSSGLIKELLPDVWDYDAWTASPDPSASKGPSRPSEGNNRLAMLSDLNSALVMLPEADRGALRDAYEDGGMSYELLAAAWDTTEAAARKRVDRIIDKIVDRLGGPPPWFPADRKSRSNAAAQSEVEK